MHRHVMLSKLRLVCEGEIETAWVVLLANVVSFSVVGSQTFNVLVNLELDHPGLWVSFLLALFFANVAKVVILAVMQV